jgi:tetratricopeptide (TPR) repeat protein
MTGQPPSITEANTLATPITYTNIPKFVDKTLQNYQQFKKEGVLPQEQRALLRLAQYAEAVKDYQTAINVYPNTRRTWSPDYLKWFTQKGEISDLLKVSDLENRLFFARTVKRNNHGDPTELYQTQRSERRDREEYLDAALISMEMGDLESVAEDLSHPINEKKGKILLAARIAKKHGLTEEAEKLYNIAIENLKKKKHLGSAGKIYLELRDYQSAFDCFVSSGSFFRAILLKNKVGLSERRTVNLQQKAVEERYWTRRGNLTAENLALRYGQEKFLFQLLLNNGRIESAKDYAQKHCLGEESEYVEKYEQLEAYFVNRIIPEVKERTPLELIIKLMQAKGLDDILRIAVIIEDKGNDEEKTELQTHLDQHQDPHPLLIKDIYSIIARHSEDSNFPSTQEDKQEIVDGLISCEDYEQAHLLARSLPHEEKMAAGQKIVKGYKKRRKRLKIREPLSEEEYSIMDLIN